MEAEFHHQRLIRIILEEFAHRNGQPRTVDQIGVGRSFVRDGIVVLGVGVVVHEIAVRARRGIGRDLEAVVPAIENAQVHLGIVETALGGFLPHALNKRLGIGHLTGYKHRGIQPAGILLHPGIVDRHVQRKVCHLFPVLGPADQIQQIVVYVDNIRQIRLTEGKILAVRLNAHHRLHAEPFELVKQLFGMPEAFQPVQIDRVDVVLVFHGGKLAGNPGGDIAVPLEFEHRTTVKRIRRNPRLIGRHRAERARGHGGKPHAQNRRCRNHSCKTFLKHKFDCLSGLCLPFFRFSPQCLNVQNFPQRTSVRPQTPASAGPQPAGMPRS